MGYQCSVCIAAGDDAYCEHCAPIQRIDLRSDPLADSAIKEHGGIAGIEESSPGRIVFRLGNGSFLTLWESAEGVSRVWAWSRTVGETRPAYNG